MAKYGQHKYGTFKYGVSIDAGGGDISPSGSLSFLKVYVRYVGDGMINITKSISKNIVKLAGSAEMIIDSTMLKMTEKFPGNRAISITGSIIRSIMIYPGKGLVSSAANVAKNIFKRSGGGAISIVGSLNRLKYYFLVTKDMILQPLGLLVSKINRSLMPPTRDTTEEIPGRNGEIDFGSWFGSDVIELEVASDDGMTAAEIEASRRSLAAKLNPATGERDLVLEYDNNKSYKAKYSGKIPLERFPTWFRFTLPFKLLNPFANDTDEKSITGSGTITNAGTFETGLTVSITGPATNPSLTIGGIMLAYTGTLSSGQTLTIDTDKLTTKIGTVNAMAGYNGSFPLLQPGSVSVTAGSNVTVKWRDKWL